MRREYLLAILIRQLQFRTENIEKASTRLKVAKIKNKDRSDKIKRIWPRNVQEGDWVFVYNSSLDNEYNII